MTAQNAQMVLLKDSDTDRLRADYKAYSDAKKKLEEQADKLKKDWESAKKTVVKKYKDIDWGDTELSKDFRIAIPHSPRYSSGSITLTPSIGYGNTSAIPTVSGSYSANTVSDLVVPADPPARE